MVCVMLDSAKSHRRLALKTVFSIAALALVAGAAFSEQPPWEEEAGKLFMTRNHWWMPIYSEQLNGLWSFEPESGSLRRLRPLSLTVQSDGTIPRGNTGFSHFLAAVDTRMVVQVWPHYMDFEVPSWRLLRRYPPNDGYEPVGWTVQGPMVGEGSASALGLEPGIYGFAVCVLNAITSGHEFPPLDCDLYQFPGWEAPDRFGDSSSLMHRSLDPALGELSFAARTVPYEYYYYVPPPLLSFDPGNGGFWRAGPRSIEFLPVVDGVIGPASITHQPGFPPFDTDDGEFLVLHFHPQSRRFFGTAREFEYGDPTFFALDEDFSLFRTYNLPPDGNDLGWPISITSLSTPATDYVQTIPAISHTPGRYGTFWATDLWLFNPSGEPMSVSMRRVTAPGAMQTVDLPAHGSMRISDILTWMGGGPDGDGVPNDALVLTSPFSWGEQLVATSRTFTTDPDGATYGLAGPAVPGRVGYSNHLPRDADGSILYQVNPPSNRAANLTLDRRTPGQFRHNLGIVNDSDTLLRITLLWGWMDPDENKFAERRPTEALQHINVQPHTLKIVNLEERFPPEVRDGWPPRVAVYGDRPALVWLSMVDNLTGDGTLVPYTNFHYRADSDHDRSVLPVIAYNQGRAGTFWRTDLYGFQGNAYGAFPTYENTYDRPVAFFHPTTPASQCGGAALSGEISAHLDGSIGMPLDDWVATMTAGGFPPSSEPYAKRGWRVIFPDAIHLFAECEGEQEIRGGLEISTASWTSGYSRTYTTRDDGGTYGSMLPLYPPNGWPVQHFAGIEISDEFRINVGFFNGDHDHAITHRLTLYREDGSEVASVEFTLGRLKSRLKPLENLFGLAGGSLENGTYALTVLPLDDDTNGIEGRSWAYVSVVDNASGDSSILW